jgi:hypothetical protein
MHVQDCIVLAYRSLAHDCERASVTKSCTRGGGGGGREIVWIFFFSPPPCPLYFSRRDLFAFSPEIALPTSCRGKWRSDEEITKLIGQKRLRLYNRRYYPTAPIRVRIRLALNLHNGTFVWFEPVILSLTTRRAERNTRAITERH